MVFTKAIKVNKKAAKLRIKQLHYLGYIMKYL